MVTQPEATVRNSDPTKLDTSLRLLRHALNTPTEHLSNVGSWHAHIPFAYGFMDIHRPRLTVELGVHKGDSYLTFCRGLADHKVNGRIFGVDTWQGDSHAGSYESGPILSDLKMRHVGHEAYSKLLQKTFDDALADIEDDSVDLLHIDGLHTYEAVKHDLETWRPKLSPRGVVMFHDTQVRTLDFGVWKLWAEIKDSAPSYEFPYGHGLGVLALGCDVPEETKSLLAALHDFTVIDRLPLSEFVSLIGNRFADSARVRSLTSEVFEVREAWNEERVRAMAEINRLNEEIGKREAAHRQTATQLDETLNQLGATAEQLRNTSLQLNIALSKTPRAIIGKQLRGIQVAARDPKRAAHRLTRTLKATRTSFAKSEIDPLNEEIRKSEAALRETENRLNDTSGKLKNALNKTPRAIIGRQIRRVYAAAQDPRRAARTLTSKTLKATRASVVTAGRTMIRILPVAPETKVQLKDRFFRTIGPKLGIERGAGVPEAVSLVGNVSVAVLGERCLSLASSARGGAKNAPPRSVSIIIPVYNQIKFTLQCIEAVHENTAGIEYEIIVVDDCSNDETSAHLTGRDDIKYVRNSTNLGFIGSCNAGARRATKEYVCFLNNDTKVLPHWMSALINTFELHEGVGLVGSKLIYPDGRLQEAGGLIWEDGSGWNWGRLKSVADPRYNYARVADYCSGASIVISRTLFEALGGFDPHYAPAYGEDSDLAFKVRSLGLATIYQPLSQVVHYEGVSNGVSLSSGVKQHQVINAQKLAARWAPYLAGQGPNGVNADIVSDRGTVGRILVIDQITPEPDHDAGSITTLEIMRALRDLGYKVTFVPASNFTWLHPYSALLASLGIESVVLPWTNFTEHMARFGASYDAVVFFRPQSWNDYIDLVRKHAPQARTIYHSSDLHFLREERSLGLNGNNTGNSGKQALEVSKQAELDLLAASDLCIVHSQAEMDIISELRPESQVVCFPWIYEPRGGGPDAADRDGLVFVGGYGHPPNVDAAEYFIRDIFPLLAERLPESCKFTAAGSFPPASLQAMSGGRIAIPGYVEDLEPVLYSARVMVVPLRYGAGIKGKIISALAHGLPVVTTKIGAEGMGLVHNEHVLIADGENEFADAVFRLYCDHDLWRKLQKAGLDYVAATTSRSTGLKIVADILKRLKLPAIPFQASGARSLPAGYSSAFGSRQTLFDLSNLVQAARAALPPGPGTETIVFPDEAGHLAKGWPGTQSMSLSAYLAEPRSGNKLIIVADSTDANALNRLAEYCVAGLSETTTAAIVFTPPRLHADSLGYCMISPFADRKLNGIDAPVHERWQKGFAGSRHINTWLVDKSLTGFPSLPILLMRPR